MKKVIRLTESDLYNIVQMVIMEQKPDGLMPGQIENFGYRQDKPETWGRAIEAQKEHFKTLDPHLGMGILSVVSLFVPVIGPLLSMGIELADAALYYKEGDKKMAGMMAVFSLLPFSGAIVSRIPGVKQLGSKAMATLGRKIATNSKLTKVETEVVRGIYKNQKLVQQELSKQLSKKASQHAFKRVSDLGKAGLKFVSNTGAYVGVGYVYDKLFDSIFQPLKGVIQKAGFDVNFVMNTFGCDYKTIKSDIQKLDSAWKSGWRPGKVVPKQFQTVKYAKVLQEENQKLKKLNDLINSAKNSNPQS